MAIVGQLPVVRVRAYRVVNNVTVSPDAIIAEPTVDHLTVSGGAHGYIDLQPVVSQADPDDPGVLYLDLPVTDDPDVNEAFAWRIRFTGSQRPTRLVSVPQSGPTVETIVNADGLDMPAVWLDTLADFTGYSGPTAPVQLTQSYVDTALDNHEAAADPHPGYATEAATEPRLLPTTVTDGQGVLRSDGTWVAADMATDAELTTGLAGVASGAATDATAKVTAHRDAIDPHGDRAAASSALAGHVGANDPHGDRAAGASALETHRTANDPHGDRQAAATALEAHRTATDPHGDRVAAASDATTKASAAQAAATSAAATDAAAKVEAHRTASDPHGDRAAASSALAGHVGATDPHGDRAAASTALEAHRTATDPHGDRAYADTGLAGRQPLDADLTTIAAINAGQAGVLATDGGGWLRKTYTQLKTALAIAVTDLVATGTANASTYLRGDGAWVVPPSASGLTQTSEKTAAYTAAPYEAVPLNTTGGAFTLTLPAGAAVGTQVAARWTAGTAGPTISAPSGETIGAAQTTTLTLPPGPSSGEFVVYQKWTSTLWLPVGGFKPQTALAAVFVPTAQRGPIGGVVSLGTVASGTVSPDAATANHYAVTATGNLTLGAPAGTAAAGQTLRLEILASGAQRVITFSGSYAVMTGLGTTLTIPSGKLGRVDVWNPTLTAGWTVIAANVQA